MGGHVSSRIGSFLTSCLKTVLKCSEGGGTVELQSSLRGGAAWLLQLIGVVGGCGYRTAKTTRDFGEVDRRV